MAAAQPPSERGARLPLWPVALISAAALGYQLLLMRLFSVAQWHHFAYMMISLALLGYGAAGAVVTLARAALLERFRVVFPVCAGLFGLGLPLASAAAQRLPFNALEVIWQPAQLLWLAAAYLTLALPFFCAALALCLAFARFGAESARLYAFDIVGAALGSLAALAALHALAPEQALPALGAVAVLAAWLAAPRRLASAFACAAALALLAALPASWLRPVPSPYKALSQTLAVKGARLVEERSTPLGLLSVVENREVAFRHAPGLSLAAGVSPPAQLLVFVDGEGASPITRFDGDLAPLAYLDHLTTAAPYHLLSRPRVLVLGAGTGAEVLQARYHDARAIDAVELNGALVDLVQRRYAEFSGRPYTGAGVRLHVAEARSFVAASLDTFDLIQLPPLDAFGVAGAGLHALSESYAYTVEAFGEYLRHLAPGGWLAATRWVNLPPNDAIKLFATAVAALERAGVADAGARLALVRSWRTATLLVKNGAITPAEVQALREFGRARAFDLAWLPGVGSAEDERYNRLDRPYFKEALPALAGAGREDFIARYKFHIEPASDDRPHFHRFFRWRTLPELLRLRESGALPPLDWGYPALAASLAQALLAACVFILLPLRFARAGGGARLRARTALYFSALGLGFMLVEMALLQRYTLILGHPIYAAGATLFSFLVFAGVGARLAPAAAQASAARGWPALAPPLALIGAGLALHAWLAAPLLALAAGQPQGLTFLLCAALAAPLALAMGMPFPLGLTRLAARAPTLLPWAWGINASVSVVAAVGGALLAIHWGYTATLAGAALAYLAAGLSAPRVS